MAGEDIVSALVILFVTIDPVGLAPIFLSLTVGMNPAQRSRAALRATVVAFLVLLFFALVGEQAMRLLGVGIPAFQIAGGLLLFWIAFEMVFERRTDRKQQTADVATTEDHVIHVAAFPLAIPLIAGPGSITATILLTSRFDGGPLGLGLVAALQALVVAATYVSFRIASRLSALLGKTGVIVLSRLLGIVLAALAVQTIIDGVQAL